MLTYVARRLGIGVLVFVAVTGISYVLYHVRGADSIAYRLLGADARPEEVEIKVHALGLDRSLPEQYAGWFGGLFRGDLGESFVSNQDVTAIMSTRVPVTLSLIAATLVLTLVFSVVLGVWAATRGGVVDRVIQVVSVIVSAVPGYWLALVLVIVFALNLGLFPATGFIPITETFGGWLSTIFLPSIAIALGAIFSLAVWVRSSIIDMRRQDFVRTLRSRGLSPRSIMYRHVLRNAAPSIVQMLGLQIIALLGGAIIVERIFALPGIGQMSLDAGLAGDIPVVLGGVAFFVVVIVIINIAVDLINGFLNPKVRIS
ncbi:ABC transporter permease [Jiangella anatolica]|uniref:ABC transporter permease n=1 Tax=Jiangella anatolica TaxID=2670374 RepID=A0A2W2CBM0_9ACTN|nr:ABC transporter permease [Jiangella anatolica]PZF85589.1 ABC transporter permease [Jiangella anatolica]